MNADVAVTIVRPLELALAIVFAYAFATKVRHPRGFAATVRAYEILPERIAPLVAGAFILVEGGVALALVTEAAPRLTALVSTALLGIFFVALGLNVWRGHHVPCGCFGDASEQISVRSLVRVALLLGVGVALTLTADAPRGAVTGFVLSQAVGTGALALGTLAIGTWLIHADEFVRVFRLAMVRRPRGGAS